MSEKEMNAPKFGLVELFRFQNPYTRQRYWAITVCMWAISLVLSPVTGILAANSPGAVVLAAIVMCFVFTWITFATWIKRLRDAGVSLYWVLLGMVPFVNFIALIVFGCISSSEQKNTGKARWPVLIALCMSLFPVFAVAAYLVYNNQQTPEFEQSNLLPPPPSVPQEIDSYVEEIKD